MAIYAITYYLREEHKHDHDHDHDHDHNHEDGCDCGCHDHADYDLIGVIESLGAWAQFLPNGFLVNSDLTAEEILSKLEPTVKDNDIIFVTKADLQSTSCTIPQVADWMEKKSK